MISQPAAAAGPLTRLLLLRVITSQNKVLIMDPKAVSRKVRIAARKDFAEERDGAPFFLSPDMNVIASRCEFRGLSVKSPLPLLREAREHIDLAISAR